MKALYYLARPPAALPYFLGGLKIAGGLALIGAVVAEIAAGSAGAGSGLAYRIIESQFRAQHSTPVRGSGAALTDGGDHLPRHVRLLAYALAALARKRDIAGEIETYRMREDGHGRR